MGKMIVAVISVLLVTSLLFTLASCGGRQPDNTGPEPSEDAQAPSADAASAWKESPDTEAYTPSSSAAAEESSVPADAPTNISTTAPSQETAAPFVLPSGLLDKIRPIYDRASTKPQRVTTVHELAILTSICATIDGAGPITVTPAALNGENITLVTLGGTEFVEGQATTIEESRLASAGQSNDYLKAVEGLIENGTIPGGKPLLVTGISLGGMIAQQLLGLQELLASRGIQVKGVICFGSPLTPPIERRGVRVVRFADKNDMVPKLGEAALYKKPKGASGWKEYLAAVKSRNEEEKIVRKSKYTSPIEAHALSYIEDECWNEFDFFGSRDKNNVLVLKDEMKFYPAPKLSK